MIDFIKQWSNQIIVAVIIATIFEMILPTGKNKKYIKIVIGLYVLFTIIHPIITKITGKSLDISNFNYKKYFDKEIIINSSQDFENNNSKLIEQAYIDNIEEDIKDKLQQIGYQVISCKIDILDDVTKDTYGTIESINLKLHKKKENETNKKITNTIEIKDIDININDKRNNTNFIKHTNLLEKEKIEVIEYLAKEYLVNKKNIVIN